MEIGVMQIFIIVTFGIIMGLSFIHGTKVGQFIGWGLALLWYLMYLDIKP